MVDGCAAVEFGFPVRRGGIDFAEGCKFGVGFVSRLSFVLIGGTAGQASSGTDRAELGEAVVDGGQVGVKEAVVVAGPGFDDVVGAELFEEFVELIAGCSARGPLAERDVDVDDTKVGGHLDDHEKHEKAGRNFSADERRWAQSLIKSH